MEVPETETSWLMSEKLSVSTSVIGLSLSPPQLIQIEAAKGWYFQMTRDGIFRRPGMVFSNGQGWYFQIARDSIFKWKGMEVSTGKGW